MVSKYHKYTEEVIELNSMGKSNAEIGSLLGIDHRRVGDLLRINGLKKAGYDYGKTKPTPIQHDYFVANAIGDGCIFKSKANTNYRMSLAHSLKQKDYFLHKYNAVLDFINVQYSFVSEYHKVREKVYTCIKYQTKVNPYFTELYGKWYENGKKVIKKEYVKEINDRVLALKYFDDGYKTKSAYYIAMDDYDEESLKVFMKHLLDNFDIPSNLHKRNRVYIESKHKDKLTVILKKYATEDVMYKIL